VNSKDQMDNKEHDLANVFRMFT